MLDGLQNHLMEPARTRIFCEEYARAMNRLHAEHNAQRATDEDALSKVERDLVRLVQALLDGVPASAVREKMGELETRRDALRGRLAASEDTGVRLHPNMAGYYRTQIAEGPEQGKSSSRSRSHPRTRSRNCERRSARSFA